MKKIYLMLLAVASLASCRKESDLQPLNNVVGTEMSSRNPNADFRTWYTGLSQQTVNELQIARSATARYKNLNNAISDGYVDIAVDVENMGHHYLKSTLVDEIFDPAHPELLVYNMNEDGYPYLVAVEYAVPINLPEPSGFTGNNDVWTPSQQFQLWLLHAWVWEYNPDGVFNPTNPEVHLH